MRLQIDMELETLTVIGGILGKRRKGQAMNFKAAKEEKEKFER
jgi:hypothetical protein